MPRWKGTHNAEGQRLHCRVNYMMCARQKLEQKKGAHFCHIKYVFTCMMSIFEPDASSLLFSKRRDLIVKGTDFTCLLMDQGAEQTDLSFRVPPTQP